MHEFGDEMRIRDETVVHMKRPGPQRERTKTKNKIRKIWFRGQKIERKCGLKKGVEKKFPSNVGKALL